MTTRYQKSQIEDVAKVLHPYADASLKWGDGEYSTMDEVARDFADLFAADNPPLCPNCKVSVAGARTDCPTPEAAHNIGGFDRAEFLSACGLGETKEAWPNADGGCSGSSTCVDHPERSE